MKTSFPFLFFLFTSLFNFAQEGRLDSLKSEKKIIDSSIQTLKDSLIELNLQSALLQKEINIQIDSDIQAQSDNSNNSSPRKANLSVVQNLSIEGIRVKSANSAGGIDIIIQWRYQNQNKTLKYIYFTLIPYNNVGDRQKGSIRDNTSSTLSVTGPIEAKDWTHENWWDSIWYNSTITCVKVSEVRVEYMDGTSYTYVKELPKIFGSDFNNKCEYVD